MNTRRGSKTSRLCTLPSTSSSDGSKELDFAAALFRPFIFLPPPLSTLVDPQSYRFFEGKKKEEKKKKFSIPQLLSLPRPLFVPPLGGSVLVSRVVADQARILDFFSHRALPFSSLSLSLSVLLSASAALFSLSLSFSSSSFSHVFCVLCLLSTLFFLFFCIFARSVQEQILIL